MTVPPLFAVGPVALLQFRETATHHDPLAVPASATLGVPDALVAEFVTPACDVAAPVNTIGSTTPPFNDASVHVGVTVMPVCALGHDAHQISQSPLVFPLPIDT